MDSLRDECLNTHWVSSLADAQEKLEVWRQEYNESRPHKALDDLTPGNLRPYGLRGSQKLSAEILQELGAPQ